MFDTYDVIVTNNKDSIINNRKLGNNKVYSLKEFMNNYYFSYDLKTIYYVMNKYNVIYDIAKIYLDNLIYIEDKNYSSTKLNFLKNLKKDLLDNNLLYENKLFKDFIKDKKILFYNIGECKEIEKIKEKVDILDKKITDNIHIVNELYSIEDEVLFVINNICELINNGVDVNNIYLVNLDSEYRKVIRRLFPMYNIKYSLDSDESIYGTYIVSKFLELYSNNMEEVLASLEEYVNSEEDTDIYNEVVRIVNKFIVFDDMLSVKNMLITDLKNTKIPGKVIGNSVKEGKIDDEYSDTDYVFLLGFNQGIIPRIYKDESYLSDKERKELDISLTVDKNKYSKEKTINSIRGIKNLTITYKLFSNGEEYKISSINEELGYEVEIINENNYTYSNKYNKIYLASLLDEYYKYGTESKDLYLLDKHYDDINYNMYDNKYTGIDKKLLKEYLDNKIVLSYTGLDKYYRCPFSYYVGNILKLNIYEETFYQVIGTLFHAVLEKCLDSDFDTIWNEEINNIDHEFTIKEEFFLNKLKKELEFVVETIKYQETLTDLHNELHEEKIYTSISGDMSITFTGIIDKIKYKEIDGNSIVAIIDYKTGNTSLDLTSIYYGIGMQLPIYLYLVKNSNKLSNIKVAGFYIQKILNTEISNNEGKDYENEKRKNLMLQGFSTSDINLLGYLDNSYEDSNYIKSMKVKKDGSFSSYSKVLSNEEMDKIEKIVVDKINDGAKDITRAIFDIAPKRIEKSNMGCSFCKFRDICYRKNEDIVDLEKKEIKDTLGGEDNGMD